MILYQQYQFYQYQPNNSKDDAKVSLWAKQKNNIFFCLLRSTPQFQNTLYRLNKKQFYEFNNNQKNSFRMQHWCFNCSKITLPKAGMKCQFCSSEAIEEMRDENNPAQYIPFTVPTHPQPQPEANEEQESRFVTITVVRTMPFIMSPFLSMPISFVRVFNLAAEDQGTPVDDQIYEKLEKVSSLSSECAVCQEKSGSGVKLGCRHEYHEDCIKPWFKNANTCPCCRATV